MHLHDRRTALRVIAIASALRMLVAATLPLGIDESYAVVVSRNLSLSWFDHPPLSFWVAHAAAQLAGESPLAVRWPFVLMFAATSWLLFLLSARLFNARAGLWTVIAVQLIPVFSLSSGSWVLPDGPLLLASAAAALALSHAIPIDFVRAEAREPCVVPADMHGPVFSDDSADETFGAHATAPAGAWRAWVCTGLAFGVAGLSKYHAALIGLGAVLFAITDWRARRWLSKPQPWVALVIAIACVIPVFAWNAQRDWISFRFQSGRAAGHGNAFTALGQNLAGQAGYLLPWFWVPLVVLMVRGLRTGPGNRSTWFCCCLGAPTVLVFTLASLGGRAGLPHWPAPGFFLLLPLLGAAIARWERRAPQVAHRRMVAAGAVYVVLLAIVVSHAATGWVARVVPSLHRADPAFELLEYRSLRDSLAQTGLLEKAKFVASTDWLRAAKIGYALGPARPVLLFNADARHFPFAFDERSLTGTSGLLIMRVPRDVSSPEMWNASQPFLSRVDTLFYERTIPVLRGADTALSVAVFRAVTLRR